MYSRENKRTIQKTVTTLCITNPTSQKKNNRCPIILNANYR